MNPIAIQYITGDRENFVRYFKRYLLAVLMAGLVLSAQSRRVEFEGLSASLRTIVKQQAGSFTSLPDYVNTQVPKILAALETQGYLHAQIDSIRIPEASELPVTIFVIPGSQQKQVFAIGAAPDSISPDADFRIRARVEESAGGWNTRFQNQLHSFGNSGYPNVRWVAQRVNGAPNGITIHGIIHPGAQIILDTMVVRNTGETGDQVFVREMRIQPGAVYKKRHIADAQRQIQSFDFVESVRKPLLFYTPENKYGLLWEITEQKANVFNGVIGYAPASDSREGYFTGQLQFDFVNLFGTARELHIFWEKRHVITQEMAVSYTEPWVAGFPIDMTGGFEQIVQDSSYIQRQTRLQLGYQLNWRWQVFGSAGMTRVISTPSGRAMLGLNSYRRIDYTAGVEYSNLDNPRNPRRGLNYLNTLERRAGIYGVNDALQTIDFDAMGVVPISGPHVLSVHVQANNIVTPPDSLPVSELYRFGGAGSVRGYDEAIFLGTAVGWINLEYRLLFEKSSRLVTFFDYGYWEQTANGKKKENTVASWGVGLRLQTPVGQLGVDYGVPTDAGWENGRIHVRFLNYF